MKSFLKESTRFNVYSNLLITLLCTSSLFGGYYKVDLDNEVKHANAREIVDTDLEPLSQEAVLGNGKSKKVTFISKRVEVKASKKSNNKTSGSSNTGRYVPAQYSSVTGDAVVNYAKKYLGLPYKNYKQGTSLKTGTDCSGFTMLIYREFGVKLARTVSGQMRNGRGISRKELQKGDLVIYGRAAHVAIYIGNGKVIHESTYGQGVKITGIDQMGMKITAYRRVINANAIAKVEGTKKQEATTATTTKTETPKVEETKQQEETPVEVPAAADTTPKEEAVETPKVVEEKKEEVPVTPETTDNSVNTETE